jgi:hypothetical protein
LTSAVAQLSSNDRSVDQAVASVQSAADSALAASAKDPGYGRLKNDATAFLGEVVRQQVMLHVSGRVTDASSYSSSYRDAVRAIETDCR